MRGLVWLSKANRDTYPSYQIQHPDHPSKRLAHLWTPQQAWRYAAEVMGPGHVLQHALEYLGRTAIRGLAFVPIPASCTTKFTTETERWGALGFARELERLGLGRVVIACTQIVATQPKRGTHVSPQELRANLRWHGQRVAQDERIVYVDDTLTWGAHTAAIDGFFGMAKGALGICVGATDGKTVEAALQARIRAVRYTGIDDQHPLVIDVATSGG